MEKKIEKAWEAHGRAVVSLYPTAKEVCITKTDADARLIAASPKMLAALQHALKAINDYPDRQHPMTASEVIIREAILEAGGEI